MKLRKTRLAAVLMSALMVASTMSPYVYAEEEIILDEEYTIEAEGGEESVEDAEASEETSLVESVETVEVGEVEETGEVEDTVSTYAAGVAIPTNYVFDSAYFNWNDKVGDYTVKITWVDPEGKGVDYVVKDSEGNLPKASIDYDHSYLPSNVVYDENGVPVYCTSDHCNHNGKTCAQTYYVKLKVTDQDGSVRVSDELPLQWKSCEAYKEVTDRKVLVAATHLEKGLAHEWYKCTLCGCEWDADVEVPEQEHVLTAAVVQETTENGVWIDSTNPAFNLKYNADGSVYLNSDGLPVLEDPRQCAYYVWVAYCKNKDGYQEATGADGKAVSVSTIGQKTDGTYPAPIWLNAEQVVAAVIKAVSDNVVADSKIGLDKADLLDGTKYVNLGSDGIFTLADAKIENDDIELVDCLKDATYTVSYLDGDGHEIYEKTETITKHHMLTAPVARFSSLDDMKMANVYYTNAAGKVIAATEADKNSTLVVTSKSCYLDITYTVVDHCCAQNCVAKRSTTDCTKPGYELPLFGTTTDINLTDANKIDAYYNTTYGINLAVVNTTTATAKPVGEHAINTPVKKDVLNLIATDKNEKGVSYAELKKIVTNLDAKGNIVDKDKMIINKSTYVTVDADPRKYDCMEDAYVNVYFWCVYEPEPCTNDTLVETLKVHVKQEEHTWSNMTYKVVEPATCEATGLAHYYTYCLKGCGTEKLNRAVTLQMLPHTNDLGINAAGVRTPDKQDINQVAKGYADLVVSGTVVVDSDTWYKNSDLYDLWLKADAEGKDYTVPYTWVGLQSDKKFGIYVQAVTYCENDNGNGKHYPVTLEDYIKNSYTKSVYKDDIAHKTVTLTVTDMTDDNVAKGTPGKITIVATYTNSNGTVATKTITTDYYSSLAAYEARDTSATGEKTETGEEVLDGLHKDSDGVWRLYDKDTEGNYEKYVTALVPYEGGQFYVVNGVVASEKNGLTNIGDEWYFLSGGQVQNVTQLALFEGGWFWVIDGVVQVGFTGWVPYNGATFYVVNGQVATDATGLTPDNIEGSENFGKWVMLVDGRFDETYTGVAMYDNAWFVLENGVLNESYNGTIEYDGATFDVVNGMLVIG